MWFSKKYVQKLIEHDDFLGILAYQVKNDKIQNMVIDYVKSKSISKQIEYFNVHVELRFCFYEDFYQTMQDLLTKLKTDPTCSFQRNEMREDLIKITKCLYMLCEETNLSKMEQFLVTESQKYASGEDSIFSPVLDLLLVEGTILNILDMRGRLNCKSKDQREQMMINRRKITIIKILLAKYAMDKDIYLHVFPDDKMLVDMVIKEMNREKMLPELKEYFNLLQQRKSENILLTRQKIDSVVSIGDASIVMKLCEYLKQTNLSHFSYLADQLVKSGNIECMKIFSRQYRFDQVDRYLLENGNEQTKAMIRTRILNRNQMKLEAINERFKQNPNELKDMIAKVVDPEIGTIPILGALYLLQEEKVAIHLIQNLPLADEIKQEFYKVYQSNSEYNDTAKHVDVEFMPYLIDQKLQYRNLGKWIKGCCQMLEHCLNNHLPLKILLEFPPIILNHALALLELSNEEQEQIHSAIIGEQVSNWCL